MAPRSTRSRTKKPTATDAVIEGTVIEIPTVEVIDGGETTQATEGVADTVQENTEMTETAYETDTDTAFGDVQEVDEVDVPDATDKPAKAKKEKKEKKESTRPPVPEGYISPVQFATQLTERLEAEGATHRDGSPVNKDNPIKPQTIYSFIRNGSKTDPLVTYEVDGRQNLLKLDEANAWWDAKAQRVQASKASAAEKAAAKANKATKQVSDGDTGSAEEIVEAE